MDIYINTNTITIILVLAAMVVFLSFLTVVKYAITDNFTRTRAIMTAFLIFIVVTITTSFWRYTLISLWFTIPAFFVGILLGYKLGVSAAEQKIATKGVKHYMKNFAQISTADLKSMTWWSIVNFYSIMGALILINLMVLSTIIFPGLESIALITATVGALLIGTLIPYIIHLWSVTSKES
jgi:hypothetical protein